MEDGGWRWKECEAWGCEGGRDPSPWNPYCSMPYRACGMIGQLVLGDRLQTFQWPTLHVYRSSFHLPQVIRGRSQLGFEKQYTLKGRHAGQAKRDGNGHEKENVTC